MTPTTVEARPPLLLVDCAQGVGEVGVLARAVVRGCVLVRGLVLTG